MGARGGEFTVTVNKKEVVAAELPKQVHWLPLSNLDMCILPPTDFNVFFCYEKPTSADNLSFGSMVEVLKKAMAQALVSYYVLAGEVVPNLVGKPELLCNNRGVDFIEAYADIDLKDLNFYKPDETFKGKLLPKKQHGVLVVQATELKCGGLVLGCTFDHQIVDGYSANMFLFSWAEIAQSRPLSFPPSICHSLLSPRRPISVEPCFDNWYIPIRTLPPPPQEPQPAAFDHYISRIYHVPIEQINQIQFLATTNTSKPTKVESFTAFLWKMIAKCATNNQKISKFGLAVDGRMTLSDGNKEKAMVMASYVGNVVSIPHSAKKVDELIDKPLSWVASEVHGFSQAVTKKEHFLGLIDWVEANGPSVANIFCNGNKDGPAFVISSCIKIPISKVDFGWGKPTFGSVCFPWGGDVGYVMPMSSMNEKNGDWLVYMYLPKGQLKFIEDEAAHVFRPFTYSAHVSRPFTYSAL